MKIVNNILFAVMLSAGNCFAIYGRESDDKDNYPHPYSRSECHVPGHYGHGGRTLRDCCPQYIISNGQVYFDGREVKDASASGFKSLPDGYALDSWNVYYCGNRIDGAASQSFRVLGYGYAVDSWRVYYSGEVMILHDWYAKDRWNVYFDGKKIEDASPTDFEVLGAGYAKDRWNTYYFGHKINE